MSLQESIEEIVRKSVEALIEPAITRAVTEIVFSSIKTNKPLTPYLNVEQAAKYLNTTRQSLNNYMRNGVVKFSRLNGSPRFLQSDLDAALIPVQVNLKKHNN